MKTDVAEVMEAVSWDWPWRVNECRNEDAFTVMLLLLGEDSHAFLAFSDRKESVSNVFQIPLS